MKKETIDNKTNLYQNFHVRNAGLVLLNNYFPILMERL